MLLDLNNRGITVAAEKMSAQLGMPHHAPLEGLRMTGKHCRHDRPANEASRRHQRSPGVHARSLAAGAAEMRSKKIDISVRDRTITMVPAGERIRDFGLSR